MVICFPIPRNVFKDKDKFYCLEIEFYIAPNKSLSHIKSRSLQIKQNVSSCWFLKFTRKCVCLYLQFLFMFFFALIATMVFHYLLFGFWLNNNLIVLFECILNNEAIEKYKCHKLFLLMVLSRIIPAQWMSKHHSCLWSNCIANRELFT